MTNQEEMICDKCHFKDKNIFNSQAVCTNPDMYPNGEVGKIGYINCSSSFTDCNYLVTPGDENEELRL